MQICLKVINFQSDAPSTVLLKKTRIMELKLQVLQCYKEGGAAANRSHPLTFGPIDRRHMAPR